MQTMRGISGLGEHLVRSSKGGLQTAWVICGTLAVMDQAPGSLCLIPQVYGQCGTSNGHSVHSDLT